MQKSGLEGVFLKVAKDPAIQRGGGKIDHLAEIFLQHKQTKQVSKPINIYLDKTNSHFALTYRIFRETRQILLQIDVISA